MTTNAANAKVETYRLTASNGRHIRMATRVVLEDGQVINFTEKMSNRRAIQQAEFELARQA
jgi:hypothetical protein